MILARVIRPVLALAAILPCVAAQGSQPESLAVRNLPAEWRASPGIGRYAGRDESGPNKRDLTKITLSRLMGRQDSATCDSGKYACYDDTGCCHEDEVCCDDSEYCAPQGGECCNDGSGSCQTGYTCCGNACIPEGSSCCDMGTYCAAGNICVNPFDDYNSGFSLCCTDDTCLGIVGEDGITTTLSDLPEPTLDALSSLLDALATLDGFDDEATATGSSDPQTTGDMDDMDDEDDDSTTATITAASSPSSVPSNSASIASATTTGADAAPTVSTVGTSSANGASSSGSNNSTSNNSSNAAAIEIQKTGWMLAYSMAITLTFWL
ncbi:hypothetical protein CFIMG_006228RA [Ceratocystis fimbriata CBS 114723]|uniref:GPI anchored protein n=1 Tax=Ceratocystis fimbriata CBS 114723 TaxID=1035309 RepID=A0A2C5W3Y7_9PEZI|nr:hypothetical protein CFIMG_006228RA [Ceratocystis fimbriata CBS 114723]